ncbi:MAG TPA: amylo-alpha-1,6-glucosidase, partial [Cyclobacteriaceae bacterium]
TKAPAAFILELLPFYSCRDFHSLSHANDSISRHYLFDDGLFRTLNYERCPEIFIQIPGAQFIESKNWYYNVEYAVEQYRGLDYKEDLYSHGKFSVTLNKGDKLGIILSTENPTGRDVFSLFSKEKKRREALVKKEATPDVKRLILASDQFIVKRGKLKTIIAGYHWFADWGRDTMISLPGLCLVTGRYNDAKNILKAFASSVSEGMLPNRFSDYGEAPEYNTVDATLWFFHAIYKYYCYTKDIDFIKKMLPILQDIIAWHIKGTRYSIKVDPHDLLLNAGEEGVQLTWMDAKVGDWVVTPRRGKAVEINALWYNALCSLSELLKEAGQTTEADQYIKQSRIVIESFNNQFWNEQQQCLYDYIDSDYKNDDLRPNQLYAISLPFPLLPSLKAKQVLDKVTANLLTPKGLRSLAPTNQGYCPRYGGSPWQRDGAYHQGTVWSFLIGPYIDALFYVDKNAKAEAASILKTFLLHLDEACLGSVSEIFDAEAPYNSRGSVAQAWGVAEVLRVIKEYDLM